MDFTGLGAFLKEFGIAAAVALAAIYGLVRLFRYLQEAHQKQLLAYEARIAALEAGYSEMTKHSQTTMTNLLQESARREQSLTLTLRSLQSTLHDNQDVLKMVIRTLRNRAEAEESSTETHAALDRIVANVAERAKVPLTGTLMVGADHA